MSVGKQFSLISIIIASLFIVNKVLFDMETYSIITSTLDSDSGAMQPVVAAGGIKIALPYLIAMVVSLALSIIGMRRKNRFHRIGLLLNLLAVGYLCTPVGFFLSI